MKPKDPRLVPCPKCDKQNTYPGAPWSFKQYFIDLCHCGRTIIRGILAYDEDGSYPKRKEDDQAVEKEQFRSRYLAYMGGGRPTNIRTRDGGGGLGSDASRQNNSESERKVVAATTGIGTELARLQATGQGLQKKPRRGPAKR